MQLPRSSAAYPHRIRFSVYLERRLRRVGATALADEAKATRERLLSQGRAWEDSSTPVSEALADRDALDDGLDATAQTIRLQLASRSIDATQKAPYTLIFPDDLRYYTEAPLSAQTSRYQELKSRLLANLPADDAVLAQLPAFDALLNDWSAAYQAAEQARTQERMLRDQLEATTTEWASLMERIYGSLTAEYGRKSAEAFFPRT